jgi:hypothetical protein
MHGWLTDADVQWTRAPRHPPRPVKEDGSMRKALLVSILVIVLSLVAIVTAMADPWPPGA